MDRPRGQVWSTIGTALCWIAAAIVAIVCVGIVAYVAVKGWRALSWSFLRTDPTPSLLENQAGGIRIPIVGTTLLVLGATLLSFPICLGAAVYLAEYMKEDRPLTRTIRLGLEVLAGVPSVVFGVFGLAVFSVSFFTFLSSSGAQGAKAAFGRSFLIAMTVMGIHLFPFVIKVMEEAIRSVPKSFRDGAAALGMTKWRGIRKIVLPAASPGIMTGVILGMGLAAGDTAIVWLLLGGTMTMAVDNWWHASQWLTVLRGTGSTLTTFIYFNSPAGEGNAPQLAFGAALVLIGIVLVLNLIAAFIGRRSNLDVRN
jgi:phosphate transport system permease protein